MVKCYVMRERVIPEVLEERCQDSFYRRYVWGGKSIEQIEEEWLRMGLEARQSFLSEITGGELMQEQGGELWFRDQPTEYDDGRL